MNKVELIYNPYQEKCRILINGNSISEYSQLANYLQESFEIWSPKILKSIEQELNDEFELEKINSSGIGPGGLGGRNTALAVNIETFPTHIAGLPVAVNICCHVNRHISRIL